MTQLKLDSNFQEAFPRGDHLFDRLMAIEGPPLRALEGRKTLRFELNGEGYYIKQHFGIGWKEIIKNLLRGRLPVLGAETEWKAIQAFQDVGIPTLKVVGFGKRGKNPARQQSFIITEELLDVMSLEDFCSEWKSKKPAFELKLSLTKEVARMARLLHRHGMNHRDFYLCHFLLKVNTAYSTAPLLYLIDLHRVQIRKQTPRRWRVKDIAGLYFSAMDIGLTQRDLLRFIKYYFSKPLKEVLQREASFLQEVQRKAVSLYSKISQRLPAQNVEEINGSMKN